MKQCSIFKELKTTLDEIYQQEEHRTKLQKFWTIATQVSAHVLVFSILGALAYVIWSTLHVSFVIRDELELGGVKELPGGTYSQ